MADSKRKSILQGLTQQKMRSAVDKYIFCCEELTHRLTEKGHKVSEAGLIAMVDTIYTSLLKEQELTLEEYQKARNAKGVGRRITEYICPPGQTDRTPGNPCVICGASMSKSRTSGLGYCRCWEKKIRQND